MRALTSSLAAMAVLATFVDQATAATTTTSFTVSATVSSACSVSATPHAFGLYDPLSPDDKDSTSTVVVRCTLSTAYDVGLNAGATAGASVTTRQMLKDSETLDYSLYKDASRSQVWGDSGADLTSDTGTGADQNITVYGRIPAGQNITPGSYSDTVTVTVTF